MIEDWRIHRGWRKVATGTWYYDKIVPKPIAVWAKPASESCTRFDDDEQMDESRPIPETKDGFLYCYDLGSGEYLTLEEAKAAADARPWGPVRWD